MAKESGLGMTVSIDDAAGAPKDLSNDITNLTWTTPHAVQDVTGVDKSAMERLLLLADGTLDVTGVFNDASDHIFSVFKTTASSDVSRTVTIVISGQTLTMEMLITNTTYTRAQDGSMVIAANLALQSGTAPTWS